MPWPSPYLLEIYWNLLGSLAIDCFFFELIGHFDAKQARADRTP
jgi:hypothetical protein